MSSDDLVYLVDVDNTLLDNDRFQDDLKAHVAREAGAASRDRYWAIQAELFETLGYRDYLGAFQRYRLERPQDPDAIWLASFVIDYPYGERLYPGALDLLARMRRKARTVLLTDGDAVFQPRKVARSGLADAVGQDVMMCVHKELEIAEIERRYPARRYVLVDDKPRILAAFKRHWGERVTTVLPRQGQFALDAEAVAANPAPDIAVAAIADLLADPILAWGSPVHDFGRGAAAPLAG